MRRTIFSLAALSVVTLVGGVASADHGRVVHETVRVHENVHVAAPVVHENVHVNEHVNVHENVRVNEHVNVHENVHENVRVNEHVNVHEPVVRENVHVGVGVGVNVRGPEVHAGVRENVVVRQPDFRERVVIREPGREGMVVRGGPVWHEGVRFREYNVRPEYRYEQFAPIAGYGWHRGDWIWTGDEWVWQPGWYVRVDL